MAEWVISGIQQVGIGVSRVYESWEWYRKHLEMDLALFDQAAEAKLMLPYTGGVPQSRHAILALNHRGGAGLEIWQHTSRTPLAPAKEIQLGDLGFYSVKYKCVNLKKTHARLLKEGVNVLTEPMKCSGRASFFARDPHGNLMEFIEWKDWFKVTSSGNGGVLGCTIGVSDMEKSIRFYSDLLGFDQVTFDETAVFDDFKSHHGGNSKLRRVVLEQSKPRKGRFSRLLGSAQMELVQNLEREGTKIFKDRMWGDLGYIHLCFDVAGMENLKKSSTSLGHPFTVDSGDSFDMGDAAGRFSYTEDPDGALIEFVETHKIPIIKKLGLFYNLKKKSATERLPNLLLKAMFIPRRKKPVWPR